MMGSYKAIEIKKDAQIMNLSLALGMKDLEERTRMSVAELWTQRIPVGPAWQGLLVVAFYMESTIGWDKANDLVVVRFLDCSQVTCHGPTRTLGGV